MGLDATSRGGIGFFDFGENEPVNFGPGPSGVGQFGGRGKISGRHKGPPLPFFRAYFPLFTQRQGCVCRVSRQSRVGKGCPGLDPFFKIRNLPGG